MVQGLGHVNTVLLMESLKAKPDKTKNEQVGEQKRTKKMYCFILITVINNLSFLGFDFYKKITFFVAIKNIKEEITSPHTFISSVPGVTWFSCFWT